LVLSLLHTIGGGIKSLFLAGDTIIWVNWILSVLGMTTMLVFIIATLELLILFSPIAPFWTFAKVYRYQLISVVFMVLLNIPSYFYPLVLIVKDRYHYVFLSVSLFNVVAFIFNCGKCWYFVTAFIDRNCLYWGKALSIL
jgi:hypothetical protein